VFLVHISPPSTSRTSRLHRDIRHGCFPMPYREDNVSSPTSSSRASFDLYWRTSFDLYCPFPRREDNLSFPTSSSHFLGYYDTFSFVVESFRGRTDCLRCCLFCCFI
jgi:hypothetical protein